MKCLLLAGCIIVVLIAGKINYFDEICMVPNFQKLLAYLCKTSGIKQIKFVAKKYPEIVNSKTH